MTAFLKRTLIIGLILRLFAMPFFFHPDMKSQYFHFQFLSQGHLNIYEFIGSQKSSLPYQDTFNYLPLTYLTFGTINSLLLPFHAPGFSQWINDWGPDKYSQPNIPYFLLILKIPYLILDLAIFWLIFKISKSAKLSAIWLLNPLNIYLIYILGNFDILPSFLTLLSLYYLNQKRGYLSLFFIGLAVALKAYPIMFLPFYLPYIKKDIRSAVSFLFPILVSIVPFLYSPDFLNSFLGSGLTQKLLETRLLNIPIFPVLYFIVFLYSLVKKISIHDSLFLVALIFLPLVHFHPQWLMWFLPSIYISLNHHKYLIKYVLLYIVLFFAYVLLFNDQFLSFGHLIPIDSNFLLVRTPYDIIRYRLLIDPAQIQHYIRLIFTFLSLLISFFYVKNHRHTN